MTIAAGILCNDGIVLCADTMMSGAVRTTYESKITGYKFRDGIAVFALSGYVTFAQSAVQDCEAVLRKSDKPRTHAEIVSALKPVLSEAFSRQITRPGLSIIDFYYDLIVAVWSSVDGLGLYYSDHTDIALSTQGYQLAGTGHDLAEYILRPILRGRIHGLSEKQTLALAAYSLANVRAFQSGLVGGDPVIFMLRHDGTPDIWRQKDFDLLDHSARVYDVFAREALMSYLTADSMESYEKGLETFEKFAKFEKEKWLQNLNSTVWSSVPYHAFKLMIDLDVKPSAPRLPQFPKRDQ